MDIVESKRAPHGLKVVLVVVLVLAAGVAGFEAASKNALEKYTGHLYTASQFKAERDRSKTAGHDAGFTDGRRVGYQAGLTAGSGTGYALGLQDGCTRVFSDLHTERVYNAVSGGVRYSLKIYCHELAGAAHGG